MCPVIYTWFRRLLIVLVIAPILIVVSTTKPGLSVAREYKQPDGLSPAEFSRLIRELSEESGYFHSDNYISNEMSYLHVIDKMRELGVTSGAYIGVGPEQNFTYIAKIRPRIAFIVDIRRQALIQHLMYKAIFHLSPNRSQFLSTLLSVPLPKEGFLSSDTSINHLLAYFSQKTADDKTYIDNLFSLRNVIQENFQFPLTKSDLAALERVYNNFRIYGLATSYQQGSVWGVRYPILKDLIIQTDLNQKQGNFLATESDYYFLRGLHLNNLIIPVVGDFCGSKTLAGVGDYLRKKGFTVSAFYTSNVEQYLFENGQFASFAGNVRKLPINDHSYFIRSTAIGYEHPARRPGHMSVTLLQQITVFLRNFDWGWCQHYNDLVMVDYIAAEKP